MKETTFASDGPITFTNVDTHFKNLDHNHPLCIETILDGYLIKKTFIDNGVITQYYTHVYFQSSKDRYWMLGKGAHHDELLLSSFV